MGDMYVPNIQRPGFGYRRYNDDEDEDSFDQSYGGGGTPASDGGASTYSPMAVNSPAQGMQSAAPASSSAVQTPPYWPGGIDWMQQGNQNDISAPVSRGGADTDPTDTEMNLSRPAGMQDRDDGSSSTGQTVQVSAEATPAPTSKSTLIPPPVLPHTQQDALKKMIEKGPKRSILGTIAAGALGFGAGYINAAGRTRPIPVPTQTMRNWSMRAPGGGAWDPKLARQQQLAEQEQGEQKQALTAYQLQAQAQDRQAQADLAQKHGSYWEQKAVTDRMAEQDRQKQQQLQRIIAFGGKNPQIRNYPTGSTPDEVAQSKDWYVRTDPTDPKMTIAVRPNPGEQVDDETAEFLGIPKGSYLSQSTLASAARGKVAAANAARVAAEKEAQRARQEILDKDKFRHEDVMERLAQGGEDDRREARQARLDAERQKRFDAINEERKSALNAAEAWAANEERKDTQAYGVVKGPRKAAIAAEKLRQQQQAYDTWSLAYRNHGGNAADFKVYPDGSVARITNSYGLGGTPIPLGSTDTPTTPTTPTGGGRGGVDTSAASAGGGRGGGANLPPRVNTAPQGGKTITKADLADYAKDHTGGDLDKAAKVFTDKHWTIVP